MDLKKFQTFLHTIVNLLVILACTRAWRSKRLARSIPPPKFPCRNQGVEWVRSPDSCTKYVVCGFGEPLALMVCPNALHWSEEVNNCVAKGSRFDDCPAGQNDKDHQNSEHFGDEKVIVRTEQSGTDSRVRSGVDLSVDNKNTAGWHAHNGDNHESKNARHRGRSSGNISDWSISHNNNSSETVTDRTNNMSDNGTKQVSVSVGENDTGKIANEWSTNKRDSERGYSNDRRHDSNKADSDSDIWALSSPLPSVYPELATTPDLIQYTTSSMPRWRWIDWDYAKANYDDYPVDYDGDDEASSSNYPLQEDQRDNSPHSEEYPSDKYPVHNYYETGFSESPGAKGPWQGTTTAMTPRRTTMKSPFARFTTTRRQRIKANDRGNRFHNENGVGPKNRHKHDFADDNEKDVDDWLKKSPWWQTWDPRSLSQTESTTARPWWINEDVLPWLTPSSVWAPDSHPETVTNAPPASKTTTVSLTTPSTTTAISSAEWGGTQSSVSELTEQSGTTLSWSSPDSDSGENAWNDAAWTEWTSPVDIKTTTSSPKIPEEDMALQMSNNTPPYHPECGVAITNMIVGGLPASEGRWPWVVSLRLTWARRHVCGGTLVHPQWLVTAAHCVYGSQFEEATDWRAVFGNVQATLTSDVKQQHKIDLIVRHPEFVNGGNYPNDIAMMRLEKPVDVSGFRIRHACLPSRGKPFLSSSECWIMGWGETKGFEEQSVLQELVVKIRRNQACAARWGWKRILNSHVCVGNGDGGACNGDSGGPLVCLRDGYYYLAGVTSWGVSGCQTTGYPSVFTRVSFYDSWINDVIQTYSTIEFSLKP